MAILFPQAPRIAFRDPDTLIPWTNDLYGTLRREFAARTEDLAPRDALLLQAPDGTVWSVTISALGALVTTKVFG